MRKTAGIIASLLLSAVMAGCSCSESTAEREKADDGRVRDKHAYALGQEHGAETVAIQDNQAELEDKLLDVRARITNISSKLGAQSARDYERGFTDYIRANSDSLARILF